MQLTVEVGSVVARFAVGIVLFTAGIGKLRSDGSVFLKAILAFEILPDWATRPVAKGLPLIEVALGASMVVGFFTDITALVSFALIAVLTVSVIHALAKGQRFFCPCLGFSAAQVAQVQWTMTVRNFVLLVACVVAATTRDGWMADLLLGRTHASPSTLAVSAMVVTLVALFAMILALRQGWTYGQDRRVRI